MEKDFDLIKDLKEEIRQLKERNCELAGKLLAAEDVIEVFKSSKVGRLLNGAHALVSPHQYMDAAMRYELHRPREEVKSLEDCAGCPAVSVCDAHVTGGSWEHRTGKHPCRVVMPR